MNPLSNNDKRNLEPENSTLNNNEAVNKKQNLGLHPPLNNVLNSLPNMPTLVKCMIFREFEDMKDVRNLANTCKSLNHVFQHNTIWKAFHDRIFPERRDVEPKGYYTICKEQQNLINKIKNKNYLIKTKTYDQIDHHSLDKNQALLELAAINTMFNHLPNNRINYSLDREPIDLKLEGTNLVVDSYQNSICEFLDLKTGDKFSVDMRDCQIHFVRNLMFLSNMEKGLEIWDLNKKSKCTIPGFRFYPLPAPFDSYPFEKMKIRGNDSRPLNTIFQLESLSNNYQLLIDSVRNRNKINFVCLDINQGKISNTLSIDCDTTNQNSEFSYDIQVEIDENDFLNVRKCVKNKKTSLTKITTFLQDLKTNKFIYALKGIEIADVNKLIGCETLLKKNYIFALLNDKSISVRDIENKPICHLKDVEFNLNFTFELFLGEPLDNNKIKQKFIYDHLLLAPKASDKCTIAVWDLAAREQIGCLVHYDEENQPSEIMQIEKMGHSLVTISKKTIKVWDVVSQSCFHLGNFDNEELLVFGNYLVEIETRSSWNIKTKAHSKFEEVLGDLGLDDIDLFNIRNKGNLLAIHEPRWVNNNTCVPCVFIFDLEKNKDFKLDVPQYNSIDWLESGKLVLRPDYHKREKNPTSVIIEF